jgi:hypothetical protein
MVSEADRKKRKVSMNIIFFSTKVDERDKEIKDLLIELCHDYGLEMHRSPVSLESRLRQPLNGIACVVMYLSNEEEFLLITSIKELISNLPLILIIKETCREMLAKAHILRPRFIFGPENKFQDIRIVLEKLVANRAINHRQDSHSLINVR